MRWYHPLHLLAFGLGTGHSPVMPGTCGTLLAIPLYYLLERSLLPHVYLILVAIFFVLGCIICHPVARALQQNDPSGIVLDEIVGFLLTMVYIKWNVICVLLGFLLFRFFDILKPWPISWCDRNIKGGLGIMLDDLVAALFANVVLQGILYFFPEFARASFNL